MNVSISQKKIKSNYALLKFVTFAQETEMNIRLLVWWQQNCSVVKIYWMNITISQKKMENKALLKFTAFAQTTEINFHLSVWW